MFLMYMIIKYRIAQNCGGGKFLQIDRFESLAGKTLAN